MKSARDDESLLPNSYHDALGKDHAPPYSAHLSGSRAFALSVKSIVGSGIFAIPYGFSQAGLIGGIIILTAVFVLSFIGGLLLIRCRDNISNLSGGVHNNISYGDLGNSAFGWKGRTAINTMIVCLQIGTVIVYSVFIIETLSDVFPRGQTWVFACSLSLIFTPVLLLRRVDIVAVLASLADCFSIIGLFICCLLLIINDGFGKVYKPELFVGDHWWLSVGIMVFSVEGVCLILPIYSSMKSPTQYPLIWTSTMTSVYVLYLTFGVLGYLAFGQTTDDIVLSNFRPSPSKEIAQIIYCLSLVLSASVQALPAFDIMERSAKAVSGTSNESSSSSIGRMSLGIGSSLIACYVPGFAMVVTMLGCIFGSMLTLGIPAMLQLQLNINLTRPKRVLLYILMAVSICSTILGLIIIPM